MFKGNQEYRKIMSRDYPGLLERLSERQSPPFFMLTCADSRVSEQDIFNAKLGTMFTASNIANQFNQDDAATSSVLAFSVGVLKVKHIVVMGHYGCAGVAAAMVSPPAPPLSPGATVVQEWISPIRRVFRTSERPELVAYRQQLAIYPDLPEPEFHNPAFRALVEENVKASVKRIKDSEFIREHFVTLTDTPTAEPIFVHGWVYDMEDGLVHDLKVSAGPPGTPIPSAAVGRGHRQ
jgi:carbonic anhydrase